LQPNLLSELALFAKDFYNFVLFQHQSINPSFTLARLNYSYFNTFLKWDS
jgi:hypothetical protein